MTDQPFERPSEPVPEGSVWLTVIGCVVVAVVLAGLWVAAALPIWGLR